jgi:hypothetical protein
LKLVVWPIWLISDRIDWNSVSSAVAWLPVMPLVEAFGGQRNSAVEKRGDLRQGAIGGLQQADAVAGVLLRLRQGRQCSLSFRSAIDNPAGSSEPELIFRPVESCVRVFCRLICVLDNAFSAVRRRCYSGL